MKTVVSAGRANTTGMKQKRTKGANSMYAIWNIKASDIAAELNRCGTYEEREIISAAEKLGYTCIEETGDMLEAIDPNGGRTIIAEQ